MLIKIDSKTSINLTYDEAITLKYRLDIALNESIAIHEPSFDTQSVHMPYSNSISFKKV